MRRPPGSKLPAIAQQAMFMTRPVYFVERARRIWGDIYTIHSPIFGHEIVVTRPETIRTVLRGDPEVFRGGEANSALSVLVGPQSVLILDGKRHRRERQLLMPPFHGDRMRSYSRTIRDQTWRAMASWTRGEVVSLQPHMQRITLEVILRTVFGMEESPELVALRDALKVMLEGPTSAIGMLPLIPALQRDLGPLWPWDRFKRMLEKTDAMIYAQIAEARRRGGEGREDILSLLLSARDEAGQPMSDPELRDELVTLLTAGHETTALALAWAFEQILLHPEVLARLLDELDEVVGAEALDEDHCGRLPFLDATIRESLRVRPIIPFFARKLSQPTTIQGYDIPAGDMVVPCSWLVHRDPDVYPEPARFRPERFLDKRPDPYAWIPFGGGGRRCIGMAFALHEMKVVIASVLTKLRIRLAVERPSPVKLRGFAFAPKGGTRVVPLSSARRARAA